MHIPEKGKVVIFIRISLKYIFVDFIAKQFTFGWGNWSAASMQLAIA